MVKGFWKTLPKPIFALAPMMQVTNAPFRRLIAKYAKPDVMFTEFIHVRPLLMNKKDNALKFRDEERPIVAQIWGNEINLFYDAAQVIKELGFDGIDLNFGCPEEGVCKSGGGAAMINKPEDAKAIIRETKRGAGDLPVSVKTRIGFDEITIDEWLKHLLDAEPDVITIHGRTRKEMSKVPCHWDQIGRAVEIVKKEKANCLILGNGDVQNLEDAYEKVKLYNVDGVMLGRAIFGNVWLFDKSKPNYIKEATFQEKIKILIEFAKYFCEDFKEPNMYHIFKRHIKSFCTGVQGASKLRELLAKPTNDNAEITEEIILNFCKEHSIPLNES